MTSKQQNPITDEDLVDVALWLNRWGRIRHLAGWCPVRLQREICRIFEMILTGKVRKNLAEIQDFASFVVKMQGDRQIRSIGFYFGTDENGFYSRVQVTGAIQTSM